MNQAGHEFGVALRQHCSDLPITYAKCSSRAPYAYGQPHRYLGKDHRTECSSRQRSWFPTEAGIRPWPIRVMAASSRPNWSRQSRQMCARQKIYVTPDLALVLYLTAAERKQRNTERNIATDTFELKDEEYFERVRHGYKNIITDKQAVAISGSGDREAIHETIWRQIESQLQET